MTDETDDVAAAGDALSAALDAQVTMASRASSTAAALAEEFRQRTGIGGDERASAPGAPGGRDHPPPRPGDDGEDFSQERIVF